MKCLKKHNNGPLTDDCLGPHFKKNLFLVRSQLTLLLQQTVVLVQ